MTVPKFLRALSRSEISRSEGETDEEFVLREHSVVRYRRIVFLGTMLVLLLLLAGYKITLGSYDITLTEVYGALWDHLTGHIADPTEDNIVWKQRLPRVLTAVLVGIGLASAGSAMQSMMKNPLADPYTTGISSGALFGATLAMTVGISLVGGYYGRVLNAFIFAMVPALLITLLSKWKKPSPAMMILVGISIMYIFNALQAYMMLRADPNSASSVYTWSIGSIGMTTWEQIPLIAAVSLLGFLVLFLSSAALNVMNSGDDYAKSLGIDADRFRIFCLFVISLMTAGIVSFTGIIGFVGLVSPHIARIFVGSDNRVLIPASAMTGACMMLLCDIVAFHLVGTTLQIGVVTAMIGGPLFMAILLLQKREVW